MPTDGDATERQPTGQGAPLDPTADALPPDAANDRTSTAGPPDDPAPLPPDDATPAPGDGAAPARHHDAASARPDGATAASGASATTVLTPLADGAPTDGAPTADALAHDPDEPHEPRLLRRLLGAGTLALDATPRARLTGWLWALAVTAFGGVLRFWDLARPHALVFDETYYVKQAFSLLVRGYEASWGDEPNPRFEAGDTSMLGTDPEYVVHPPVGKWMIALGMRLGGGVESSFAWRLAAAVCGTLAVLMIARIARRLFASTALGTVAGLFLALDGQAIVQSRISLLDPFLMFFVLAAFGFLLLDREQARRRLATRTAALLDAGHPLRWGPGLGFRWWRLAAGVALGLAIGTKWSGLYFLAVFGLLTVAWDATARRSAGVAPWVRATLVKDAVVAFLVMVPTALLTYVASWAGWFASNDGWNRQWAASHPGEGVTWLPPALRSLWAYHQDMWRFHNGLETPHSYAAGPLGWIVQWRPTSFYYPTEVSGLTGDAARQACGADSCSQAILAVGNPVLWWAGAAAVLVALFWLVRYRDWRAGAVLSGLLAGWVPWFAYAHRTIFTFYTVAFVPWVVLTLVYVLGLLVGPRVEPDGTARERRARRATVVAVGVFVAVVAGVGLFFYPVWAGWVIPWQQWHVRMWLPTWI
ncbi:MULTISPECIES: dolichyl-phosphate-mannose--protein mannosyltransferase [Cellulomonas]|uniref:Polyprenol-phosphate-mannose--protein mannosyltransferase n=1 Tax=Cellulomonas iranensis TaxID=76862 RepID=A0ABU0GIY3_9CELL|nr:MULTISPECIES: phospholipid carrier-dependent glycosyltransferase [Cellulomonas]MDQ0424507.1 putative membrane-bound dolichyl-phosphate-mannose-protein mannosyltransferase [Cellulomonas iranensis]